MSSLTDTGENRTLDWATGNSTTAPVLPLKLAAVSAVGSDATAGTEVTGGSYARQTVAFSAASGGATSNTADVTFTGLPAGTIAGVEVWDSAATPVRWWHMPLTAGSKTFDAGDAFTIKAGDLDLSQS